MIGGHGKKMARVTCVVDDAVQRSSSFWGEHGVAFLIEAQGKRVLFDTGQSGTVLLRNLELLGVGPKTIDAVALSHAHYDHSGGLEALLKHLRPGTRLHANPDLFRERHSRREGEVKSAGLFLGKKELAALLTLELSPTPQEIIPGLWTSGEILDRPEPQGSSDYHFMRLDGALVTDTYSDDMALILETGDQLVLLCGCCHAGLLNTLARVKRTFERPIAVVAGGLHLTSATDDDLRHVGEVLSTLPELQHVYTNHCTGEAAFVALTQILGPSVVKPCPAGAVLKL
jgi:7,8-dihydropterin-6-yl-methyl-4-(beta-D-ribofuranosyl)aminobenzene 5'-phosphate synthase